MNVEHRDMPDASSLVLVAYMPNPRDMEIARILGWYRIPLRTSPKVISVDYLAFYQPASFGESKWKIEYIAPVLGHELTTRAELLRDQTDHKHANEEYFKIQLGTLRALPVPIKAVKWKRITFLYTTGDYLLNANSINDLVVHSEERKILWKALSERASESQSYKQEPLPNFDIDDDLLAALLGIRELQEQYHG